MCEAAAIRQAIPSRKHIGIGGLQPEAEGVVTGPAATTQSGKVHPQHKRHSPTLCAFVCKVEEQGIDLETIIAPSDSRCRKVKARGTSDAAGCVEESLCLCEMSSCLR